MSSWRDRTLSLGQFLAKLAVSNSTVLIIIFVFGIKTLTRTRNLRYILIRENTFKIKYYGHRRGANITKLFTAVIYEYL